MKKLFSILIVLCSYYSNSQDLQIGDEFGGGIVFDIDQDNNSCLVAYTSDIGSYPWGCSETFLGADGTDVGTGQSNTQTIVNACDDFLFAAEECYNFSAGGYSDWSLPSKDELLLMYYRISSGSTIGNIGNFNVSGSNSYYWSSSEHGEISAWIVNMNTGYNSFGYDWKTGSYSIRPIRTAELISSGCTDTSAYNYDENASQDNGSCLYSSQDIQTAYQEGVASVIPEDGISQSDVDSISDLYSDLQGTYLEATTSLSSLQQALDTWNTTIDLSSGWNMFGYGCPNPIDVVDGLSNHTESISITKDNNGNVYMPEFSFNGIGDLTPGFGYQIKVTEAIEGFSLCEWYVNDIPQDNIISLQEENANLENEVANLESELDSIYGCVDENACNYDALASLDDGSCEYPEDGYDCDGNLIAEIGDEFQGGILFYIDETGEHGLVAAPEDLSVGAGWQPDFFIVPVLVYGYGFTCSGEGASFITGSEIGDGYNNTMNLIENQCNQDVDGTNAITAVINYENGGYSDWYIPSLMELSEIYNLYNTVGNGGFGLGNFVESFEINFDVSPRTYIEPVYTSSTSCGGGNVEIGSNPSYFPLNVFMFSNGALNSCGPSSGFHNIRPIRSF
jgi:hypothetical protein